MSQAEKYDKGTMNSSYREHQANAILVNSLFLLGNGIISQKGQ
jgi:hypothetical protein